MFNPIKAISKPFVVGILGSSLGGPVAAMLMGGANKGGLGAVKQLLDGLKGLFGKASGAAGATPSPRPLPFSTANLNAVVVVNPLGALQGGQGTAGAARNDAQAGSFRNPIQQLTEALQKLVAALTGGKAGAAGAASGGSPASSSVTPSGGSGGSGGVSSAGGAIDRMIDSSGSKIDSLMGQAEKLMASDKMSDQLKGQRLMQQAMRLFEMISKMLEQRSQMQAKAIQAIK